jgi:hypothetical protein
VQVAAKGGSASPKTMAIIAGGADIRRDQRVEDNAFHPKNMK